MTGPTLTPAQERYLTEIRLYPGRTYNGRARRTVEALEAAGLIRYDYGLAPHQKGNGLQFTETFTCYPV